MASTSPAARANQNARVFWLTSRLLGKRWNPTGEMEIALRSTSYHTISSELSASMHARGSDGELSNTIRHGCLVPSWRLR